MADRKAVFLNKHCRQVFSQPHYTTFTTRKYIRKVVRREAISITNFHEIKLVTILHYLIGQGLFRAEASLQLEFPNLHQPSLINSEQSNIMESITANQNLSGIMSAPVWLRRCDYQLAK